MCEVEVEWEESAGACVESENRAEREAEQGHWPGVAHVGYINNRVTRGIDIDPVRGPLVARLVELYASGDYGFHDTDFTLT